MTWISVSDRLPFQHERVWAYAPGYSSFHAVRDFESRQRNPILRWFIHGAGRSARETITHWMVLPLNPNEPKLTHLELGILQALHADALSYGGRLVAAMSIKRLTEETGLTAKRGTKAVDHVVLLQYAQWCGEGLRILGRGVLALHAYTPSPKDIENERARMEKAENERWFKASKRLRKEKVRMHP